MICYHHVQTRSRRRKLSGETVKKLFFTLVAAASATFMAAQAGPVFHDISAANVTVIQNDTNNNATSVTLVPTLSINDFRTTVYGTSRADYGVQIGPVATNNVANGILLSSISDNGRNNHEVFAGLNGTRYGTAAVDSAAASGSKQPGSSGIWWVPVFGNLNTTTTNSGVITTNLSYNEYNFDFSAAWFPYTKYYGGWLANSGATNGGVNDQFIGNTNLTFGPVGANVQQEVGGKAEVDLTSFGLNSTNNAVMLCVGGKNEENYGTSEINWTNGTWEIGCHDDQSGGFEQDYIAWVVIPVNNTNGLVAGTFATPLTVKAGEVCVNQVQGTNAPYTVVFTGTGTYHLTIPGATPSQGVLIVQGAHGDGNNSDNFVSFQANGNGWDIQTRDTGNDNYNGPTLQTFSQVNHNGANYADTVASFVYIPAPSAAVNVTPATGLATTQSGGTATFSVVLGSVPTDTVTLTLTPSDASAVALSTASLLFSPTNYNVPQTVTVTGLDNGSTSLESYTIGFTAVSNDTNYNDFEVPVVSGINIPTGTPGVFLTPTTGLTTAGPGSTATFSVILNQPPTAGNVNVSFTSSDTIHGGTVLSAPVIFTPDNWSTPQSVTVTGADDGIVDGNVAYQINSTVSSTDPNYSGITSAGSVSLVNLETDAAGISTSLGTNTLTTFEGSTANFSVVLTAQPVDNVTIGFTSSNPNAGTVSPASLTFTPANWNTAQTVGVTGVANVAASNVVYSIAVAISSANYGYSTLTNPALPAMTVKPIGLPSGTTLYGLGMPPVGLDGQATASDAVNFNGATLTFSLTANADPKDALGLRNDPTGAGITVSGNAISYAGNPIGAFSGGTGSSPLVVTLNSGVTGDTVAALIQAVTFSSTTTNAFADRTVQLSLNNGASLVTKTVRVGQLRATQYQDGVDWGYGAYASETNDEIAIGTADSAWPTGSTPVNGLLVQGGSYSGTTLHQVLLGFYDLVGTNPGQIPPGSTIVSADLILNIQKAGQGWAFHRMLTEWDDTDTWNSFPYGGVDDVDVGDNQAEIGYYSQMGNFISTTNVTAGTVSASTAGIKIGLADVGVTPDVQAWVNGTNNFGWVCDASQPWGYDDLTTPTGFTPGESATPSLRPHLRVYWLPPQVAGASFQNGTNGYTSGHDTEITQSTPNNTNAALGVIWSDGADANTADVTESLFRFDNIIGDNAGQVPPGAHIEAAFLNLSCLDSTDCNGNGGQFFALYQPWDESSLTWNSWNANGAGIVNDGVQAAVVPTATAGTFTVNTANFVSGGYHAYEVTADVQSWANGAPNYGWGVVPWSYYSALINDTVWGNRVWGADGWGINSSKSPNISSHPQLVVYYTPTPGYVARPALMPLTVSPAQVAVKFSGSVGVTYTVWRTDSLNGTWVSVGTATVGPDGTATFNDTTPLPTTAFYRVSGGTNP